MRNTIKKITLGLFCLSLVACASDNTSKNINENKAEENEVLMEDNKEASDKEDLSTSKETSEKDANSNEDIKDDALEENIEADTDDSYEDSYLNSYKDGIFRASLLTDKEARIQGLTYVDGIFIEDDLLKIQGSLYYNENADDLPYENGELLEGDYLAFRLNDQTQLKSEGGMAKEELHSVEEFNDLVDYVKDSGLGLIIDLKEGEVKSVIIAS
ncbi:MAG: hypothetical protein Q4D88_06260 [Anaerococcus sp.]|nr:hypothetical protein [Anaerococcus sp.]